jgi:2-hydroxychromene-2-carboxylate isomerase
LRAKAASVRKRRGRGKKPAAAAPSAAHTPRSPVETVRFYFSFRSPYSWFAFLRIEEALSGLPVVIDYIPIFPPKDYPRDLLADPVRCAYVRADAARFAKAYGLKLRAPNPFDTDWLRPSAAYLFAADCGCGREFAKNAYAPRFNKGRNIGKDDVIAEAARSSGIDQDSAVRAAADPAFQKRVVQGFVQAGKDGVFGVPTFVYRGEMFWGNDRIDWLKRAIATALGQPVPDLKSNPLAPPCK